MYPTPTWLSQWYWVHCQLVNRLGVSLNIFLGVPTLAGVLNTNQQVKVYMLERKPNNIHKVTPRNIPNQPTAVCPDPHLTSIDWGWYCNEAGCWIYMAQRTLNHSSFIWRWSRLPRQLSGGGRTTDVHCCTYWNPPALIKCRHASMYCTCKYTQLDTFTYKLTYVFQTHTGLALNLTLILCTQAQITYQKGWPNLSCIHYSMTFCLSASVCLGSRFSFQDSQWSQLDIDLSVTPLSRA